MYNFDLMYDSDIFLEYNIKYTKILYPKIHAGLKRS